MISGYDLFISYSHKDADWVRSEFVPRLEHHGFRVFIDYRDSKAGALLVEEIADAVERTRRTVAVLTPAYIQSEWTRLESAMAQTLDPGAAARKLIPVLRQDCDIPLRLRVLYFRDLRKDDEGEWERLTRDLI